MVSTNLSHPGI